MPNIKSAKKRVLTSRKAYLSNMQTKTQIKNLRRSFFESVDTHSNSSIDKTAAETAFKSYCSILDRAAKKGTITKNTAVRRKTRAAEWLRKVSA